MTIENLKTVAGRMACATRGLPAWSWDAFPAHKARIVRKSANHHGTRYDFDDGSTGFVEKGSAAFLVYSGARARRMA